MSSKHFLALSGSPHPTGVSQKLAIYLADGLGAKGWQTEVLRLHPSLHNDARWRALETAFQAADAIAICAPLYVDSLPAETIAALERLAAGRAAHPPVGPQWMLAIVQCGFIEAHQNDVALEIYAEFARELDIAWSGGLAIGGGAMLGGMSLTRENRMVASVVQALDETVAAMDKGVDIPAAALDAVRRPLVAPWLYGFMANLSMYSDAWKNGAFWKLGAQPDAKEK